MHLVKHGDFARWLYSGHKPNRIARILNRLWAAVHATGIARDYLATLEVIGRKSGRTISLPVAIAVVGKQRYLVSMLGDNVQWVRNVRAAGGKAVLRAGYRKEIQLLEVPVEERAPILKAYLRRAPGARPHIPVDRNAPLHEFEQVAAAFPVFRITPARGERHTHSGKAGSSPPHGVSSPKPPTDVRLAFVTAGERRSPMAFFGLACGFAVPFWLLGARAKRELLPGLPVTALMAAAPLAAAAILVYRESGMVGVQALLQRSFDFTRIEAPIWYAPTLLLMPVAAVTSFRIQRLTGVPVPNPRIELFSTLLLCCFFFIGAVAEELGWSGYAIDPMQARLGAAGASVVLGAVWAAYHYIALAQAHRSVEWIAWWSLGTVALRVILVWLYNNTGGSVFATSLFHMTINVTWQLYPVNGSYFDPRISGLIMTLAAAVICLVWYPRTLVYTRLANPTGLRIREQPGLS